MTTEQKAKAYDEAIERASKLRVQNPFDTVSQMMEHVFPELCESEDEKARKALVELVKCNERSGYTLLNNVSTSSMLDWLEKQGEPQDKGEISDGYHTFNELYYYRMLYNAAFFNMLPKEWVHKSKKHHDGEDCFGGGWFIVMANLPTGQISNHYELKDWDLFQIPEKEVADKWDGHTPQEAADRLHKYLLEKQDKQPSAIRWYDVSLIPQEMEELLVEWDSEDATWHEIAFYHADTKTFWNGTRQVENVTRWCYITDLLEKQDEQELPIEQLPKEMKTIGESLGFTTQEECDEYNQMVSELIMSDKVEPKFKVKYAGREYNVLEIKEIAGVTYYGIEDEPNHIDYVLPDNCEIVRDHSYGVKEKGSPYPTKPAIFAGYKPTDEAMKEALRTEYEKGRADAFAEMQKEWGKEDEKCIRLSTDIIDSALRAGFCVQLDRDRCVDWFNSIKDRLQPQTKQEWSEEDDEKIRQTIINEFKQCSEWYCSNGLTKEDCINWLNRQKYFEWSDEDNENMNSLCVLLDQMVSINAIGNEHSIEYKNWLKSLKQRYAWKPSDAQMIALEYIIKNAHNTSHSCKIAKELLEQLKKLKREEV